MFKILEEKKCQHRSLPLIKASFKNEKDAFKQTKNNNKHFSPVALH